MKLLFLLTALCLSGCISAQVYYPLPNGGKAIIGFTK